MPESIFARVHVLYATSAAAIQQVLSADRAYTRREEAVDGDGPWSRARGKFAEAVRLRVDGVSLTRRARFRVVPRLTIIDGTDTERQGRNAQHPRRERCQDCNSSCEIL